MKQQLDADEALALAGLAAALGDVEGEPARRRSGARAPSASPRTACARRRTGRCRWRGWSAACGRSASGRRAPGGAIALHAGGDPAVRSLGDRRLGGIGLLVGLVAARGRDARQTSSTSAWLTRLDLPEPETPITAVITPSGKRASSSRRLLRRDAASSSQPCGVRGGRGGGSGVGEQVARGVRARHLGAGRPAGRCRAPGRRARRPRGRRRPASRRGASSPGRARPRTANCRRAAAASSARSRASLSAGCRPAVGSSST